MTKAKKDGEAVLGCAVLTALACALLTFVGCTAGVIGWGTGLW